MGDGHWGQHLLGGAMGVVGNIKNKQTNKQINKRKENVKKNKQSLIRIHKSTHMHTQKKNAFDKLQHIHSW